MYLSYKTALGRSTVRWAHYVHFILDELKRNLSQPASHLVTYETMSFGGLESEILNLNSGNMLDSIQNVLKTI